MSDIVAYYPKGPRTVEVDIGNKGPNETAVRRNAFNPDKLLTVPTLHNSSVKTLYDIFRVCATEYGSQKCFGSRPVVKLHEEQKEITKKLPNGEEKKEKKTWKFYELGPYEWTSYLDVKETAETIGAGLVSIGLSSGGKLGIFANTSKEWMMVAHGCFSQGVTIVTAYDTLGEEGLAYALNQGAISHLFTTADLLPMASSMAGAKVPTLSHIIYTGTASEATLAKVASSGATVEVLTLARLLELGRSNPKAPSPPAPADLACIMYTSGTTGTPKGVLLTHGNVIAAIAGIEPLLHPYLGDQGSRFSDVYAAFLPLAHILELTVEHYLIFIGIPLGYGTVRTLTDQNVRGCLGDLRELRPTIMCGVPAVWEGIRKAVTAKLAVAGPISNALFSVAMSAKASLRTLGVTWPNAIIDRVVFKKVQAASGGRLRLALSGGAPIAAPTQHFLTTVLCPIVQGYGLTEASGIVAITRPDDDTGRVGELFCCVEAKLVDCPDLNYISSSTPPQGEVWVRGANVTSGYYKLEEQTREVFTPDGWFMTGDIGQWNADGTLSLIDRKKNLVKLSNGEYIALEKLETVYRTDAIAANLCVVADPLFPFPVAVVVPAVPALRTVAKSIGAPVTEDDHEDLEALHDRADVRKAVLASLQARAKEFKLVAAETIGNVYVTADEWTPESGLLTAAMKVNRKAVRDRYKAQIDAMFTASPPP